MRMTKGLVLAGIVLLIIAVPCGYGLVINVSVFFDPDDFSASIGLQRGVAILGIAYSLLMLSSAAWIFVVQLMKAMQTRPK